MDDCFWYIQIAEWCQMQLPSQGSQLVGCSCACELTSVCHLASRAASPLPPLFGLKKEQRNITWQEEIGGWVLEQMRVGRTKAVTPPRKGWQHLAYQVLDQSYLNIFFRYKEEQPKRENPTFTFLDAPLSDLMRKVMQLKNTGFLQTVFPRISI